MPFPVSGLLYSNKTTEHDNGYIRSLFALGRLRPGRAWRFDAAACLHFAAAHGVAQSYTAIPEVHANYLHGEMVAMGTLAQLVMESRPDEAERVAQFFARVGLPVHLGQLSLGEGDAAALDTVSEAAMTFPFISNMPMAVTPERVRSSILEAHRLGLDVAAKTGDEAYRRLHQ
ncbi:MAG: iron-containing alcohol dehydrogenase [Lysobacterales bacterium]|jgi:glycerol dehydrogenase